MNIFIVSLETIVISYFLQKYVILKMVKDAAMEGYRFNLNFNLKGFVSLRNYPNKEDFLLPFYNFYRALLLISRYNVVFPEIMNRLIESKILEKMSQSEVEDFNKNPTIKNAMSLPKKMAKRLAECNLLTINSNNQTSYIYFKYTEDEQDIEIVKVMGYYEYLGPRKQKEIALEILNGLKDEEYINELDLEIEEQNYNNTINKAIANQVKEEANYNNSNPKKLVRKKENNYKKENS